jgi:ribosomal protein L14E/L6E/L27E
MKIMKNINNPLVLGQIVKSKSGHDKGNVFFVVEVIDDDYVLIADGDRRKSESPKKKKVKHLQPYNRINEAVAEKLAQGIKLENIELQRELEKSGVIELTVAN